MLRRALLLALLLCCCPRLAAAQALIPDEPPNAGPLRINAQNVSVEVVDRVARVRIEQEFYSTAGSDAATYLYPMPRDATITGFSYWVKGQEVPAKLLARAEAERRFAKGAASGRGAALLQEVDKITFQSRVAPILPDTTTRVRLEYLQVLPYVRNEVTCILPLKVLSLAGSAASFHVDLRVRDQHEIARFSSPTHPEAVRFESEGPHGFTARFAKPPADAEPILKISYRLRPEGLGATLLSYRKKGEAGYFLLQLAPTSADTRDVSVPRDIVFVFDRSGSMKGEKIEQAHRALALGLEGLRPGDRFDIIGYDAEILSFRDRLVPVEPGIVAEAAEWGSKLTARSGTNIRDALLAGMKLFEPSEAQRLIVFLTDGLPTVGVTDKNQIVHDVTAANTQQVRLFAWGFGKDADDQLLARLAAENHAAAEHYAADEVIEAKLRAFYQRSGHPILLDPQLQLGAEAKEIYPTRLPDLYHGVSLLIVGRYADPKRQPVALAGSRGRDTVTEPLGVTLPEQDTRHPWIAQLWARARAAALTRSIQVDGEQQGLVEQIVDLSRRYSILTPYTSFVAEPPKSLTARPIGGSGAAPAPALVGQTRFAVAGDPRIVVRAPAGTTSAAAVFPWGDTLSLVETRPGRWTGRFIVPAGTPDGSYDVQIVTTDAAGRQSWSTVTFFAAVQSPAGKVEASLTRVIGGWRVGLTVRVRPGVALVYGVREGTPAVPLARVAGREYYGELFLPEAAARGAEVRVVLMDAAHNRTVLPVPLGLR